MNLLAVLLIVAGIVMLVVNNQPCGYPEPIAEGLWDVVLTQKQVECYMRTGPDSDMWQQP